MRASLVGLLHLWQLWTYRNVSRNHPWFYLPRMLARKLEDYQDHEFGCVAWIPNPAVTLDVHHRNELAAVSP